MAITGEKAFEGLNKLQDFTEREFVEKGWTPAEVTFILHQLAMTYHISFDEMVKRGKYGKSRSNPQGS